MEKPILYIDGVAELRRLNEAAEKAGYNRQLDFYWLMKAEKLADDTRFPISFHMVHEHKAGEKTDPHMRVVFNYDDQGNTLQLDMSMKNFNSLPGYLPVESVYQKEEKERE
tara:strand:+ start:171 stop:503 length:333 start_codon:yes stop_codon:yes gene_type:complete